MKIKVTTSFDWLGLVVYLLFNTLLAAIGIDVMSNPMSWVSLNALLVWSDLRSYRLGLEQGGRTVKEIWGLDE